MARLYKYDVGDKIQCKDDSYNIIVSKTVGKRNESAYMCNCENGHLFKKYQTRINTRCPYCINFIVEKGINDISTTNKEMFDMIKDKEYAYNHHDNSTEKIEFICPICKHIHVKSPNLVKKYGLGCPHCSDGYSYGEKFIMYLLDSLNIRYINQYSSKDVEWCDKYRYDFYLYDYDCIIEVHGEQHYKNTRWGTYEDIHNNDVKKELLAKKYVKYYIVLDVRKSELNYIKKSILLSQLINILYLSKDMINNINWEEINKKSLLPIIENIVEKYNNYSKDISELSKLLHFSKPTIVYYLKEAALLNLCDYNSEYKAKKTLENNHAMNSERGSKPIICLEDSNVFRNSRILQSNSVELYGKFLDFRYISSVCNGHKKSAKGLHFKFITRNEFNNIKDTTPSLAFGNKFYIL